MRLVGIASLALLSGCPLVQVTAELEEVCITRKDVHVAGVTETSVSQHFTFDDLSEIHDLLDLDAEVAFVRAEVRPTGGVDDLAFVDAAQVAFDANPVFACDGDCPTLDHAVALAAAAQQSNAADYLTHDKIDVSLDVTGQLPTTEWTVDVDACVKGSVSYSVEP
jgi:hypothetical protein